MFIGKSCGDKSWKKKTSGGMVWLKTRLGRKMGMKHQPLG